MKLKLILICLAATTLFNGCKKDEPAAAAATTDAKTDLLCGKNWMLTAFTVNPGIDYYGNGIIFTNLMGTLQPCEINNIVSFTTAHAYTIDEGATKCTSGAPQTFESGTWAFNGDQSHLLMTNTANSVTTDFTLVALNATTAQISQSLTVGATTYVYTKTFTKQ